MEFCRRWGIVEEVEGSPYPLDYPQDNVYVTSVVGYELGREPVPSYDAARNPPQSPQRRHRCPQDMFDPILRRFATATPHVDLRYRSEVVALAEHEDGVEAIVRDTETGRQELVTADYVVGCDGASSRVREMVGTAMSGKGTLTYTTNLIFRSAELPLLHDKGLPYRFIIIGPEGTWATIVAINGGDRWRMSIIGDEQPRSLGGPEIDAAIQRAVGVEFQYEVLSVVPWVRRELVADQYSTRRLFIAGDAAHVMSPTGGFGMNTGIGDAVDLSWKLAAVLEGWGDPDLLATYGPERQPVAVRNMTESSGNLARMLSPRLDPPGQRLNEPTPAGERFRAEFGKRFAAAMKREWHTLGIHLGYRYDASPLCVPDGTEVPPMETMTYVQTARPGARAPHVWLADGRSTLDVFGRGFVLLRLGAAAPPVTSLVSAARTVGVPLEVVSLAEAAVGEAYGRHLVLVRPDGHVAWRGDDEPDDASETVEIVRGARVPGHISEGSKALEARA
jgi:2-polyprenyl-6-methoxyphenol hydroxylase-like FAD-dependent oxidoreductase